jgi:hypothetical protein
MTIAANLGRLFSRLVACTSASTHGIGGSVFDHELTSVKLVVL